ncbi:MAG: BamA/TamA family outer membrane protein [Myxococcota bacterium]
MARYVYTLLYGPENPGKPQFLAYPVLAYAPETRLEVGLSGLVLFHSRGDVNNRLSEVPLYVFYTLNRQYGLTFEHAIFSNRSRRSFLGEGIIANFPLLYYGIGLDARYDDSVVVFARQLVARERVLFRLGQSEWYLGPEVGISSLGAVRFEAEDGREVPLPRGGDGTTNVTAGLGLAYDTRHNPLNVRDGAFAELAILASRAGLLSEYSFHNVYLDLRGYRPVSRDRSVILAGQILGQFGGGDLPFNELGLIGGDGMMRGYYRGRYRDRHLVAAQAELRILPLPLGFTRRIGLAAFVASGTVYPSWSELRDARPLYTAGGGLRVLTFPSSDIYTRVEFGISEDGPGFYLYVGEAF